MPTHSENHADCESELTSQQGVGTVEGQPSDSTGKDGQVEESSQPLTGYELIADLMRRQDDVISELDSLNLRVESAIKEVTAARKLEQADGGDVENGIEASRNAA